MHQFQSVAVDLPTDEIERCIARYGSEPAEPSGALAIEGCDPELVEGWTPPPASKAQKVLSA